MWIISVICDFQTHFTSNNYQVDNGVLYQKEMVCTLQGGAFVRRSPNYWQTDKGRVMGMSDQWVIYILVVISDSFLSIYGN